MKSRWMRGEAIRLGSQERLSEDLSFMLKIWVIPGRERNMSKGFKAGKKKSDMF